MRTLVALVLAVVVALMSASAAPAAQSGAAGFLAAEHPNDTYWGAPATDKQLMDIGLTACAFHGRGLSDEQVLMAMMGGPSMMPLAGTEARERGLQRVRNAIRFLCP
jgi:hypothetical protein